MKRSIMGLAMLGLAMAGPPLAAMLAPAPAGAQERASAVFAGGCFWCVEEAFDKTAGVTDTVSGYTGGTLANPTYEQVTREDTGHYEAVRVEYDPARISYEALLDVFWRNVDPFDGGGQFCDRGASYRAAIFAGDEAEQRAAEQTRQTLDQRFDQDIAVEILPAATFYPAEDYHQNYYQENPVRYQFYKWNCGRAQRLEEIWGAETGS